MSRLAQSQLQTPLVMIRSGEVLSQVILGGVKVRNRVPVARFNPKSATEVQLISNIPTQITLVSLPKRQSVKLTFISSRGKTVPIGSFTTTKSGTLTVPPLIILNPKGKIVVRVESGKYFSNFVVRATS